MSEILKDPQGALKTILEGCRHFYLWLHPVDLDQVKQRGRELKNDRIAFTHTLLLAGGHLVAKILKADQQTWESFANFVLELAHEREESLRADSFAVVDFFEQIKKLTEDDRYWVLDPNRPNQELFRLNHSKNPEILALSMPEIEAAFKEAGWFFDKEKLYLELKQSKEFKLIKESHNIKDRIKDNGSTLRAWCFEIPGDEIFKRNLGTRTKKQF
ncbi:MAG: hypothetical protein A2600_14075 [Candidatus Lambdaproteobacteria bacterium RIFOXYD1_FULL_56_27]|uniref:Uncharacterized protein n=1 Tax=Candidatus Lambdaproteobacteria bacterium RIFOXYD2_FULL_56_26 TaxID=1817773 RepID=A0A1F6H116_9PROT|nr:MAG: hypothetical protein A2557_14110 [Candidatus Lambdaproteobacteria bacterium RIFOXYD2_FULL_56_26]OGH08264.1 MAG: hypothetical protein A2600_14075 [Candidatus Lambdaproteobacteria bacterium RIFOXYD1_FULL_56_27]